MLDQALPYMVNLKKNGIGALHPRRETNIANNVRSRGLVPKRSAVSTRMPMSGPLRMQLSRRVMACLCSGVRVGDTWILRERMEIAKGLFFLVRSSVLTRVHLSMVVLSCM